MIWFGKQIWLGMVDVLKESKAQKLIFWALLLLSASFLIGFRAMPWPKYYK